MRRTVLCLAVVFTLMGAGCARNPSANANAPAVADDGKPVAPPTELVGKWRLESKDEKSTKTMVSHYQKDGRVETDIQLDTPDLKTSELVKRAVVKVEKDRIAVIDLSRTGTDGVEQKIPAEKRRTRTFQFQVKGEELHWTEVDASGKPVPEAKPVVWKRVKE